MEDEQYDVRDRTGELVERALGGDPEAITNLYDLYRGRMIAVVHHQLGHTLHGLMESADLVQSVWTDVLKDMEQFEYRGPDSFFRWLHTCLIHKIQAKGRYHKAGKRDAKKARPIREEGSRREGADPPTSPDPTPSEAAIVQEEQSKLMALLDRFPSEQRRVLILRMKDELSYGEISERIGKSISAVKKIYSRGLDRLFELLPGAGPSQGEK